MARKPSTNKRSRSANAARKQLDARLREMTARERILLALRLSRRLEQRDD